MTSCTESLPAKLSVSIVFARFAHGALKPLFKFKLPARNPGDLGESGELVTLGADDESDRAVRRCLRFRFPLRDILEGVEVYVMEGKGSR
jgi:hypothetical protein